MTPPKPSSPLPWRTLKHSWQELSVVDANRNILFTGHADEDAGEEDVSERVTPDADYIVRACNAFPKLVEALDAMVSHHYDECDLPTSACAFCHAAREALALAKGEEK